MFGIWDDCTGVVRGCSPLPSLQLGCNYVGTHIGSLQQSKMQILQNHLRDAYRVKGAHTDGRSPFPYMRKGEITDTQSVTFNFVLRRTHSKTTSGCPYVRHSSFCRNGFFKRRRPKSSERVPPVRNFAFVPKGKKCNG